MDRPLFCSVEMIYYRLENAAEYFVTYFQLRVEYNLHDYYYLSLNLT